MKHLILIPFLLQLISPVKADTLQSSNYPDKLDSKHTFTISGICKDSRAKTAPGRLTFEMSEVWSNTAALLNVESTENQVTYDGRFQSKFNLHASLNYLWIGYACDKSIGIFFSSNRIYVIERGDQISCEIYADSIWFSGKGAEKMNIQANLFKISDRHLKTPRSIEEAKIMREAAFDEQIVFLNSNKTKLSQEIYDLLYTQCYAAKASSILKYLQFLKQISKRDYTPEAKDFYAQNLKPLPEQLDKKAYLSPFMVDFLFQKLKFENKLLNPAQLNNLSSHSIINTIAENFDGKIREILFLIAFTELPRSYLNVFSDIDKAINLTSYLPYKKALIRLKTAVGNNAEAYPFSLPDSTGNIIKSSDFKGKVLVMEFWFTGCIPCRVLAKQMGPIIDHFKNKDVVFLTVSTDFQKDNWINNGLKSKLHTHERNVNLYTEGLGHNHPIIKYYNINSYPRLIIINKEGKVITSTPPRPINPQSAKDFIAILEKALK
ncbi:TlpA family protein disulfide reductase [Pedobacter nyackensis]|uniref:Cytochrome oxidase Cu insertion factor, SCO1/SenC/PrrC family n=1 Tax=Pedobacter nyackensis TaxID=475255 RepID=A0A1W2AI17_9SPHI|nr:TlpA disulfide reductase family protein [Pedobacter nyackensis]SMC60345.1 Cytochrome oxidase Cu insertion factor, SCO1/SenC/PrrC family [Pedobacter nyackensis]